MKKLFSVVTLAIFAMSVYGQILSVEDINLEKNTQKVVAVSLNNPQKQLTLVQFDLVLPQGISIVVDETSLNPSRIVDHQLFVEQMDNHTYRFLVLSETNANFIGSEGDIIYVPFVTGDIPDGTLAGSLEKQIVCASDAQPDYMANVKIDVKVSTTQSLSFGASGLLTCVSKFDIDFSEFEDVKAYIATGFDIATNELWLTNVTDVPAGTPMLLVGQSGVNYSIPSTMVQMAYADMLKGDAMNYVDLKTVDSGLSVYIMNKNKFSYLSASAVSMMGVCAKGFVYLAVPTEYGVDPATNYGYNTSMVEAEVISMTLDGNRTAINGVKASRKDEGVWYNLQGQRVENPRKGLYILDGKKKVLK